MVYIGNRNWNYWFRLEQIHLRFRQHKRKYLQYAIYLQYICNSCAKVRILIGRYVDAAVNKIFLRDNSVSLCKVNRVCTSDDNMSISGRNMDRLQ